MRSPRHGNSSTQTAAKSSDMGAMTQKTANVRAITEGREWGGLRVGLSTVANGIRMQRRVGSGRTFGISASRLA